MCACRLYPANDDAGLFNPSTFAGAWDKTSGATVLRLSHYPQGNANLTNTENVATNNYDVLIAQFVSEPLQSAVTIDGTLQARLMARESNADANDVLHVHAWVTQGDSGTARGTLLTDFIGSTEFGVDASLYTALQMTAQTLSSVAASAGDRIVIEVGYQAQNTTTLNRTGGIKAGGGTSAAGNGDADGTESPTGPTGQNHWPWFEFSKDLDFDVTYLYFTGTAAPVTPGAVRGTWDVDNKLDRKLGRTPSLGGLATRAVSETSATNPTDGLALRFVSDQLAAQTINAKALVAAQIAVESSNNADAFTKVHIYVMAPDGSVRGTLLSNNVGPGEIGSGATLSINSRNIATASSVTAQDGDRIVAEIGGRFTNTSTTSFSVTHSYDEASGYPVGTSAADTPATSTTQVSHIRLTQFLVWLTVVEHIQVVMAA